MYLALGIWNLGGINNVRGGGGGIILNECGGWGGSAHAGGGYRMALDSVCYWGNLDSKGLRGDGDLWFPFVIF